MSNQQIRAASRADRKIHLSFKPAPRFDDLSIFLHWMTVLFVLGQFITGWLLGLVHHHGAMLLDLHRSLGSATWVVVAVRLAWRFSSPPPPFPAGMSKRNQRAARLNEHALYTMLVVVPLSGIANAVFRGKRFSLFGWQVPALMAPHKSLSHWFHALHAFGAWGLLILIVSHAGAALMHALILRDGVLQRMLPRSVIAASRERASVRKQSPEGI
jgi:cytochrome b561